MKLRKLKKAQAKASRDTQPWMGGIPVMAVPAPSAPSAASAAVAPSVTVDIAEPMDIGTGAGQSGGDEAVGAVATDDAERIVLAETMYRAANARLLAAEARELDADERLEAAETAERAAAERLAAAELSELAVAERLAAADDRERAVAERLAAADERERAAAERLAAVDAQECAAAERAAAAEAREQAAASRAAVAEARERSAMEREALALQRDRVALERDSLANERERTAAERRTRPDAVALPVPGGASADHELEIARLQAELERAHLDSLTGALRREIGRLTLHNEIERARRTDGRFVLAFVDVDDLKGINDREGHAAGDRVLRTLAATLRANLRTYDPVVRYGGDEFVCGVTGVNASELEHRMTLIDQSLRRATGVGISAGMATLLEGETLDEITARADAALLEAKRNRER